MTPVVGITANKAARMVIGNRARLILKAIVPLDVFWFFREYRRPDAGAVVMLKSVCRQKIDGPVPESRLMGAGRKVQ